VLRVQRLRARRLAAGRARLGRRTLSLRARLLAYLMRNQGLMLTRKQLLDNVWGWEYAGQSQVLETYVSYLRRKLDPLGPPLIHTQRGVGYSLRPPG